MENNNENKELRKAIVNGEEPAKGFFSRLLSGVIDQCVVVGSSLIAMLIMDGILRLAGYYIADRIPVFFILYVVANIVYPTILQGTRLRSTLGNRLFR